ncbi:MAG: hypothetical protein HIU91_01020 [Acidobacteria bacterium]|nr:hypothetical protein [Acidobacteriota bacterium]
MHTKGHDMGKPEGVAAHAAPQHDTEHPGYETQDVNIGGVVTFLAGLAGFVTIFFFFCFAMGKAINYALAKHDGPADKWHTNLSSVGVTKYGQKREDLTSNATLEQRQLQRMTQVFPTPRLETDDGNQDLADLHAREDLLLHYYSSSADLPSGTIRIPIDRAMQLVVQRGLPQAAASDQPVTLMAGESKPVVTAPLTNGFARTGYELQTIEARNERNEFKQAQEKR